MQTEASHNREGRRFRSDRKGSDGDSERTGGGLTATEGEPPQRLQLYKHAEPNHGTDLRTFRVAPLAMFAYMSRVAIMAQAVFSYSLVRTMPSACLTLHRQIILNIFNDMKSGKYKRGVSLLCRWKSR